MRQTIVSCVQCPRLREYCERIAREKRRAFRDETYWGRPVPGFGDPRARLLIVGLAPAAHGANRTGRVFTGDGVGGSGDFLMSALHRAGFANMPTSRHRHDGLKLRDAFIAAAVRCAPPDNKPTPEEIANCLPHLEAEIAALPRIRVIVALGKIAFDAYLQLLKRGAPRIARTGFMNVARGFSPAFAGLKACATTGYETSSRDGGSMSRAGLVVRRRPQFGHGATYGLANGQTLVGCYHPSRQNTNTGRLTARMMDDVFRVVRRVLRSVVTVRLKPNTTTEG